MFGQRLIIYVNEMQITHEIYHEPQSGNNMKLFAIYFVSEFYCRASVAGAELL